MTVEPGSGIRPTIRFERREHQSHKRHRADTHGDKRAKNQLPRQTQHNERHQNQSVRECNTRVRNQANHACDSSDRKPFCYMLVCGDLIEQAQRGSDKERQQRSGETECDQRAGIQQSVRVAHRADGKHRHEQSKQILQNESNVESGVILLIYS